MTEYINSDTGFGKRNA